MFSKCQYKKRKGQREDEQIKNIMFKEQRGLTKASIVPAKANTPPSHMYDKIAFGLVPYLVTSYLTDLKALPCQSIIDGCVFFFC